MSRLNELIAQFCPDGVEHRRLEDCCHLEKGSTPIQKAIPGEYPLVVTTEDRKSSSTCQFDAPTVCIPLVSSRGHGVACLNQVYYQEGEFALGNILCGATPKDCDELSASFLYHYLNYKKDTLIVPLMKGGANVSLTVDSLKRIKVPVPPIEVQREIIKILDAFISQSDELKRELAARKKQYKFYRDKLLTFENSQIQHLPLGDVCSLKSGYAFKKNDFKSVGLAVLKTTNIQNGGISEENMSYLEPTFSEVDISKLAVCTGDIVIGMSGTIKMAMNSTTRTYYLNQRVGRFDVNEEKISKRFLFYVLSNSIEDLYALSSEGSVKNLGTKELMEYRIPVPSLEIQERIVYVLDNFDAISSNLSIGLPAEIEARQKQYEYYRDKLLTFKELEKCAD